MLPNTNFYKAFFPKIVMAKLSREARFENSVIRNIRRLDPNYSLKNSRALWGFPYQVIRVGYLEEDDNIALRYQTVGKSADGDFLEGRATLQVTEDFANVRRLSGRRGIEDAGWGLVAYVDRDNQVRFNVVNLPFPRKK
ncbi:hypothetical protein A3K73_08775 [Candidatus Pacearchaeota archaeon RBG_13_36_9]|nr:MAG: hypothetical protein A3K73_08775 [Candidatus Pacearchaeota archaeon RBG_13_36_9]